MIKHYENIKGIKGFTYQNEKLLFYQGRSNKIVVYKSYMPGLVGISMQSPDIIVEDNSQFWVVRRKV